MAKRIKVSKYIHDWQSTGSQKRKVCTRKDPLEEEAYQEFSRCPMSCGSCETPQHYLHCTKNPKSDEINQCVNSIAKWMTKAGTSKPLTINQSNERMALKGTLEVDGTFHRTQTMLALLRP